MGKFSGKPPLGLHAFPRQLAHVVSGPLIPSKKKKGDLAQLDLPTKASSKKKVSWPKVIPSKIFGVRQLTQKNV